MFALVVPLEKRHVLKGAAARGADDALAAVGGAEVLDELGAEAKAHLAADAAPVLALVVVDVLFMPPRVLHKQEGHAADLAREGRLRNANAVASGEVLLYVGLAREVGATNVAAPAGVPAAAPGGRRPAARGGRCRRQVTAGSAPARVPGGGGGGGKGAQLNGRTAASAPAEDTPVRTGVMGVRVSVGVAMGVGVPEAAGSTKVEGMAAAATTATVTCRRRRRRARRYLY